MKKMLFLAALAFSSALMADDIIGGILGGAIGGVIGNQFGGGDGKTAATIGGAVIGTIIGSGGNSRSYNDGSYANQGYANSGYGSGGYTNTVTTQRYVSYAQPQTLYYTQPRQTVYVQQPPRVIYVRGRHRHHHDNTYRGDYDGYGREDGYREIRRYRD